MYPLSYSTGPGANVSAPMHPQASMAPVAYPQMHPQMQMHSTMYGSMPSMATTAGGGSNVVVPQSPAVMEMPPSSSYSNVHSSIYPSPSSSIPSSSLPMGLPPSNAPSSLYGSMPPISSAYGGARIAPPPITSENSTHPMPSGSQPPSVSASVPQPQVSVYGAVHSQPGIAGPLGFVDIRSYEQESVIAQSMMGGSEYNDLSSDGSEQQPSSFVNRTDSLPHVNTPQVSQMMDGGFVPNSANQDLAAPASSSLTSGFYGAMKLPPNVLSRREVSEPSAGQVPMFGLPPSVPGNPSYGNSSLPGMPPSVPGNPNYGNFSLPGMPPSVPGNPSYGNSSLPGMPPQFGAPLPGQGSVPPSSMGSYPADPISGMATSSNPWQNPQSYGYGQPPMATGAPDLNVSQYGPESSVQPGVPESYNRTDESEGFPRPAPKLLFGTRSGSPATDGFALLPSQPDILSPVGPLDEALMDANPYSPQCGSHFLRMTVNAFPNSTNLLRQWTLPFGVLCQPLAPTPPGYPEVPVVDFGSVGVVRCKRCRTYINPFIAFSDGGRRWQCNMCRFYNDVPMGYFCPLDLNGRRKDILNRPELLSGSVEFIANEDYMLRPPQCPIYVFVIDVTVHAISSGFAKSVVEAIEAQMDTLCQDSRTLVGLLSFDSQVHLYQLQKNGTIRMHVLADPNEIFIPSPDDLLFSPKENRAAFEDTLERIKTLYSEEYIQREQQYIQSQQMSQLSLSSRGGMGDNPMGSNFVHPVVSSVSGSSHDSCLGSALRTAREVNKNHGGRMIVSIATIPSVGFGVLKDRDDVKLYKTDEERNLFQVADAFYREISFTFARDQTSVELFVGTHQFVDLATIGVIPRFTGGDLHYLPGFSRSNDGEKVKNMLTHSMTRHMTLEAVLRIRASTGVRVSAFHGNYLIRGQDLISSPNADEDKSFSVEFTFPTNLTGSSVCIQSALLHTTLDGQRRIRVHTLQVPIVASITEMYRVADAQACAAMLAKIGVEKMYSGGSHLAIKEIQDRCLSSLATYRRLCSSAPRDDPRLILPDSLKHFPLYSLAACKCSVFRSDGDIRIDERVAHGFFIAAASPSDLMSFILPRMFRLDTLLKDRAQSIDVFDPLYTSLLPLSLAYLSPEGVYALEDGKNIYLWIGSDVDPDYLLALFGENVKTHPSTSWKLSDSSNEHLDAVLEVLHTIRRQRFGDVMDIIVVRQNDRRENLFRQKLIEDKFPHSLYSYGEYLTLVYNSIRDEILRAR